MKKEILLADADATVALGSVLAEYIEPPFNLFLEGELGAGKTTLSRGLIQSLGHTGNVKSPTYTLVEPYQLSKVKVYHFDLYRLSDPEELEFMGIRDYFENDCICLIEWPDKGRGWLAEPDIMVNIKYQNDSRIAEIEAVSTKGIELVAQL